MYEMFEVLPKTKVNALQGTPRKVLFLLATWTHHKYLMLDFMGADYVGMAKIKLLCNDILLENGAVIYLEHDDRNVKRPKFEINL